MFLIGSSGTGKTLALVNALKMKVSHYRRQRKQIKILLCADAFSKEWAKDMKSDSKYGLQTTIKEYHCEPMRLKDAENSLQGRLKLSIKPLFHWVQIHSFQSMVMSIAG